MAARFGALTFLPQPIHGEWTHQEMRYQDINLRIVVDVEDTPENADFVARLKEILKQRFRQIEIWIVFLRNSDHLTKIKTQPSG